METTEFDYELPPERIARLAATVRQAAERPYLSTLSKRTQAMKRIAKFK